MSQPADPDSGADRGWRLAAMAGLSVRLIQGFIYWGGGSRRFIYAPAKLDAWGGHNWMANKFQTAMPGALLGTGHLVSFLLHHFWLLYAGVIAFSAAELIAGAMLMAGLMTRAAALVSMGFSVVLMLLFGWQGATCIDEWTMAAANLAMGTTLLLGGSGAFSLDTWLLARRPALAGSGWFRLAAGALPLNLPDATYRRLSLGLLGFVLAFDIGTYSYYRGSVIGPFHSGPVSPTKHHFTLAEARLMPDGGVRFHIYLDGGTPEAPAHVMQAVLRDDTGRMAARWTTDDLTHLPAAAITNDYAYNIFKPGPYGLVAGMGAAATVTLPAPSGGAAHGGDVLVLTDVNGREFRARVAGGR